MKETSVNKEDAAAINAQKLIKELDNSVNDTCTSCILVGYQEDLTANQNAVLICTSVGDHLGKTGGFVSCKNCITIKASEYPGKPPSDWQSTLQTYKEKNIVGF